MIAGGGDGFQKRSAAVELYLILLGIVAALPVGSGAFLVPSQILYGEVIAVAVRAGALRELAELEGYVQVVAAFADSGHGAGITGDGNIGLVADGPLVAVRIIQAQGNDDDRMGAGLPAAGGNGVLELVAVYRVVAGVGVDVDVVAVSVQLEFAFNGERNL